MKRLKLNIPRATLDVAGIRRRKAIELTASGMHQVRVAAELGISQARVSQILSANRRKRRPGPRLTMPTGAGVPA